MRFRVEASDGQTVELDAVDWMMALVRAADGMGQRVTGFSCSTRADGSVDVTDHETRLSWRVVPVDAKGTPLTPAPRSATPAPALTPGPVPQRLVNPRRRRWSSPLRKPLWSPDSTPRKGPAPRSTQELPPPNLAERLFELSLEIQACADADAACDKALSFVMGLVPGEAGSVLRGGRDDNALTFVAATGPAATALIGRELPYGQGIAGATCVSGVTIQVDDVSADPRHLAAIDASTGFRTRSLLCVPVRTESGFLGVIEVLNPPDDQGFLGWHVDVVESLAEALARKLSGE